MPLLAETSDVERGTMRKVRRRVFPLIALLYLIAFLDRASVAYGRLAVASDLALLLTSACFLPAVAFTFSTRRHWKRVPA